MATGDEQPGLSTPEVAALSHVALSTLNHWARTRLCGPSLVMGSGRRATRYWSVRDVVVVRAIKGLRDAGCPLQTVRKVAPILEQHWGSNLASAVLFWDGRDVLSLDDGGTVISLIHSRGQALVSASVVHLLTFPLGVWIDDAVAVAKQIDVVEIQARRKARIEQRGRETIARIAN